jgi:hypothetical protein
VKKQKIDNKTGLMVFLKEAWAIAVERAKINKAMRLMNKQMWSVEFLTALLYKAAKSYGTSLEMTINGPGGLSLVVKTGESRNPTSYKDESILEHLDDEVKVQQYIAMMQGKRNA